MSDSDSEIAGSNPVRAALGHSYNGYYSGLLIRQIRVRIPGGPLKIWLRRLNRLGRCPFKAEMSGSNPVGAACNAPSY